MHFYGNKKVMKQKEVQKKATHFLLLAVLVFTVYSCKKSDAGGGTTPTATQTDIATVDSKISLFMSTYNIPGASLAVSKNGKLVYTKGYRKANTTTNELVTPAHWFRLASVSKHLPEL
jgi:CubicO group peptidase (beta-lactamase class C family)